jgi:hypothetical protein
MIGEMAEAEDKAGNTAGNRAPTNAATPGAKAEGRENAPAHDAHELLPTAAPLTLNTPEKEKLPQKTLAEAVAAEITAVRPAFAPLKPSVEMLSPAASPSRAEDALNSGNAVAAAALKKEITEAPKIEIQPETKELAKNGIILSSALPEEGAKRAERASPTLKPEVPDSELKPEQPNAEDGLPRIRTYATDMSEEIRKRGSTLTSIVGAEQRRNAEAGIYPADSQAPENKKRMFLFIGGAIFLVIFGVLAVGTALILNKPAQNSTVHPAIISTNRSEEIRESADVSLPKMLAGTRNAAALNLGEVESFTVKTADGRALTAEEVLTALGAPNELARNATDVMVGIHSFEYNQPFILVRVSEYDRAFAAMLLWEATMSAGLDDFFKPTNAAPSGITSTAPLLTFSDRVSQNIDIRESQAEWPVLYGFLGRDLLLITTNESTLREILTRVSAQRSR